MNGNASAMPKPVIPTTGLNAPSPRRISTSNVPMMGTVQVNETRHRVKAMKNIPIAPLRSLALSALLIHDDGSVISNAPKNERAKTRKMRKKAVCLNLVPK